jgi:hypothetical protein
MKNLFRRDPQSTDPRLLTAAGDLGGTVKVESAASVLVTTDLTEMRLTLSAGAVSATGLRHDRRQAVNGKWSETRGWAFTAKRSN